MAEEKQEWIDEVELENVDIKWNWSHFDGRADTFNDEGDHNFTIILPEATAKEMLALGWTGIKENEPYEEGDSPEWTLKAKISYKYEAPRVYLIRNSRKIRAEQEDLRDIRRDTCRQLDVILTPSRWVNGPRTGVTAYVKELYAEIKQSKFADKYEDLEEI